MATPEDYEAAGLLRPEHDRVDRSALLAWLGEMGVTIDAMLAADATGNLMALPADRRMVGDPTIGRAEAIERTGLEPAMFDAMVTAFGFTPIAGAPPGEIGFTEAEIALLAGVRDKATMFSLPEALGLVRVLGSTFARLGEAVVSLFLADVEARYLEAGRGELELGRAVWDAVGLLDGFTASLDPLMRRHVRQATERTRNASIDDDRLVFRFAIGFVDLVGFTERTHDMSSRELAAFLRDFEGRAHDVAVERGARVVKLIGDEVMFVATDPAGACAAAAGLMAGFGSSDEHVLPRGGLAYGAVLARGGDYYGTVVNLASRLVDHAVPQEVLVTGELVEAAGDRCTFHPAGRRMIKGFADPVRVWSLASTA
jgi:class 3 adenylate cyclase